MNHLNTCNKFRIPEADFKLTWCSHCHQECDNAQKQTRFEARTKSWYDRLYNSPRIEGEDPRTEVAKGKSFVAVSGWDPSPSPSTNVPDFSSVPLPAVPTVPLPAVPAVPLPAVPTVPLPAVPTVPLPNFNDPRIQLDNLPDQSGRVLEGKPKERVLAPGGRIRLGTAK